MSGIESTFYFGGEGTCVKEAYIPAGESVVKERHPHSHLSYLVRGTARLLRGEGFELLEAPRMVEIAAGEHHGLTALTDVVWLCIHQGDHEVLPPTPGEPARLLQELTGVQASRSGNEPEAPTT